MTWAVLALFGTANLLVLYAASSRGTHLQAAGERLLAHLSGRPDLGWLDWVPVWVAALIIFAGVVTYGFLSGQYACTPASDAYGLLASGRALWAGGDPFTVTVCGGSHQVPYGIAAALIDAFASLFGIVGIYAIWGLIAFALVPLAWFAGGENRREVLVYVASSILVIPLISSQIDGATNALVPATVLLSLCLARRRGRLGAILGGWLSTARFPTVFALLGMSGTNRRDRVLPLLLVAATFAALSLLTFAIWGNAFLGPVVISQIGRRSFSLNFYGVLLFAHALPSSVWVEGIQAALTAALVGVVAWRVRSPVLAAAVMLTGIALLTPFLSFTILVWLLPVALVGARARWWLWAISVVGSLNYDVAYLLWARIDGVIWPSAVLDVVLTGLLLALLVDLWRQHSREATSTASPAAS